jgi:soluble cytochrome b562
MKKLFPVVLIFALILSFVACGGGNNPKAVMQQGVDALSDMVNALEKADSADAIADALNNYSDTMEKLAPKLKKITEDNPELKNMNKGGKVPDEYKDLQEQGKTLGMRMMSAFQKIAKYAQDPKVAEANKRFQTAMQKK